MIRQTVAEYLKEKMNTGNVRDEGENKTSDRRKQEVADEH